MDLGSVETAWETEACVERFPLEEIGKVMKNMPMLKRIWFGVRITSNDTHNIARQAMFHSVKTGPLWLESFKRSIANMCQGMDSPITHNILVTPDILYVL